MKHVLLLTATALLASGALRAADAPAPAPAQPSAASADAAVVAVAADGADDRLHPDGLRQRPRARVDASGRSHGAGEHHEADDGVHRVPGAEGKAADDERGSGRQRLRLAHRRLGIGRLDDVPRGELEGAGRGADQGHDRAVGQRRHDRAGREARRHRRRLRADHERIRRSA